MWKPMELLPALSPKIVTRFGSPPNAAMLFCTHWKTSRWSFKPVLPVALGCFSARNPDGWNQRVFERLIKISETKETYLGRQVDNWNWLKRHPPPERNPGRTRRNCCTLRNNHRRVSKPWPVSNLSVSWIPPVISNILTFYFNFLSLFHKIINLQLSENHCFIIYLASKNIQKQTILAPHVDEG